MLEIIPAQEANLPVVENLARFYVYDMSEFMGWAVPAGGLFGGCDAFFDDWRGGRNHPFLIRVDGELAGFAGVSGAGSPAGERSIQEFFVLRKFRHRGIGRAVALRLFEMFVGRWHVSQLAANTPALAFWRDVIRKFTGGRLEEAAEASEWGEMNVIRFESSKPDRTTE